MQTKNHNYYLFFIGLIFVIACGKNKDDDNPPTPIDPEIMLTYTINPFGVNPLSAQLNVSANMDGKIQIKIIGQDGEASNIQHTFDDFSREQNIPILGLYADYENVIEVTLLDLDNTELISEEIKITTEALPEIYPEILVDVRKIDKMEAGMNLVSYRAVLWPNIPYMMDAFGKIRWLLDYTDHPVLSDLYYDVGIERLQNGNWYFGDKSTNSIYEVDIYGEIVDSWSLSPYGFHHNVQEKPNGNFLVSTNSPNSIHINGSTAIDDHVVEIDRESGSIIRVWDLKESLDENRNALGNFQSGNNMNWAHTNAVIYDESDDCIIVSLRSQGVFKLDEDNNIKWVLGNHKGWNTNRKGDNLNDFLLTPLDASSNPITSTDNLNGDTNHPDFEWSWYQHAPFILPNGNLILFDNGYIRNYSTSEKYSRAVAYDIDETAMTVRQMWQYGKERGEETYAPVVSDVDWLPDTGNVLFSPGWCADNQGIKGGKIVEVNYATKEVVFEARINGAIDFQFHRAERLGIYP